MTFLFGKLKTARLLIGDNQTVAAERSGLIQKEISRLEMGKKKFIPTEYIIYLLKNGTDLNSLFDETKESVIIQKNVEEEVCEVKNLLEQKEEMLRLLKDAVELRDQKIEKLEKNLVDEKATI